MRSRRPIKCPRSASSESVIVAVLGPGSVRGRAIGVPGSSSSRRRQPSTVRKRWLAVALTVCPSLVVRRETGFDPVQNALETRLGSSFQVSVLTARTRKSCLPSSSSMRR